MSILLGLTRQSLCDFLILAKKNTYASDALKTPSKCLLSKNYCFEWADFRYEDQYFGEITDVGEEIVWYQGIPIWGMGYRGGVHKSYQSETESAYQFLKQALRQPEVTFPIRGPRQIQNNIYRYVNQPNGNILDFTGKETIFRGDIEICYRRYVGGLIYGHSNADMIIT